MCKETKPLEDFHRDSRRGRQSACKTCKAEYGRQYRELHQSKFREYRVAQYEGMTTSRYDEMFEAQGGVCAICGTNPHPDRKLCIDHNAVTGKVRSLLCIGCNAGIGSMREDPEILLAAMAYLMQHSESEVLV